VEGVRWRGRERVGKEYKGRKRSRKDQEEGREENRRGKRKENKTRAVETKIPF
jgi:hypothetical protein